MQERLRWDGTLLQHVGTPWDLPFSRNTKIPLRPISDSSECSTRMFETTATELVRGGLGTCTHQLRVLQILEALLLPLRLAHVLHAILHIVCVASLEARHEAMQRQRADQQQRWREVHAEIT
jgi:hypothetical protein